MTLAACLSRLRSFLRALLLRSRLEREMDTELQFHLDARADDLVARGMPAEEARRRARQEFGDARRWKEQGREARGLDALDGLVADLKYGLRWLARSPGVAATAIISVAIGIAANTAIFSVVNTLLLRRLPVQQPPALVMLGVSFGGDDITAGTTFPYPFYRQLRESNDAPAAVLARADMSPSLDTGGTPERIGGELVSGNYFEVLGVRPHLGRLFTRGDERAGANQVVVLSHRCWTTRFGGDPNVVGRVIRLNGQPMTIIGVTPPSFHGLDLVSGPELHVPITLQAAMYAERSRLEASGHWWLQILGRLKPGVTRIQAADTLNGHLRSYVSSLPDPAGAPERILLLDGSRGDPRTTEGFRLPLAILMGLVAIVLALVCVNVANLLLARSTTRRVEMSLRLAMGAGRARVIRQLLVEASLLALAGGTLGLLASRPGVRVLAALADAPPGAEFPLDLRVLAFCTAITVVTGLVCGLAPAWSSTRVDVVNTLKADTGQYTRMRTVGRRILAAGQIALSLALLVAAGLLARTLFNLRHGDLGFDASRLVLVTLNPGLAGYGPERLPGFYQEVLERVSALGSVEAAAFAVIPLLSGGYWNSGLTLDTGERDEQTSPRRNAVGPDFFRTIGVPLREGREFAPTDTAASGPVAIVNEAFVRRYLGNGSALGRRIGPAGPRGTARFTIVGVTGDSKTARVRDALLPFWYVPYAQLERLGELTLHLRARQSPGAALRDVKQTIAAIDRRVAGSAAVTLHEQIEDQIEMERLLAALASTFGVMALFLASLGLYSTVSYLTTARTREIGIRMALGASPGAVKRLVFLANAPMLASGSLLGIVISVLATRQLRPLLFELEPTDPFTIAAAAGLVALVTTLAMMMPAHRAGAIDPAAMLK